VLVLSTAWVAIKLRCPKCKHTWTALADADFMKCDDDAWCEKCNTEGDVVE